MCKNYLKIFYIGIIIFSFFSFINYSFEKRINQLEKQNIRNRQTTYKTDGVWKIAEPGMVFVAPSGDYYRKVLDPYQYKYMSLKQAVDRGYHKGEKSNQYVVP